MYDQSLFLQALSMFARKLPADYDLDVVLSELAESVTAVLQLAGSGVTLHEDGRLRFVTAVSEPFEELERVQERHQRGPCRDAFGTGQPVFVTDVRVEQARWPEYTVAARRLGVAGVAGIPMRLSDKVIGALNIYAAEPRTWTEEDLAVAQVLADVATSYLVNASTQRQLEQLTEQLQQALTSRVVIEQAKGITAHDRGVSVDQAFTLLRSYARSNNLTLVAVADAVVHAGLRL